jgi:hypothetical protein
MAVETRAAMEARFIDGYTVTGADMRNVLDSAVLRGEPAGTPETTAEQRINLLTGQTIVDTAGTLVVDVTNAEFKGQADSVAAAGIPDNSIIEAKLADGSVTVDKLGAGSVTADKLDIGAVTNAKIADGVIAGGKFDLSTFNDAFEIDPTNGFNLRLESSQGETFLEYTNLDGDRKPSSVVHADVNRTFFSEFPGLDTFRSAYRANMSSVGAHYTLIFTDGDSVTYDPAGKQYEVMNLFVCYTIGGVTTVQPCVRSLSSASVANFYYYRDSVGKEWKFVMNLDVGEVSVFGTSILVRDDTP